MTRAEQVAADIVTSYIAGLSVVTYAEPAKVLEGMIARGIAEAMAEPKRCRECGVTLGLDCPDCRR